MFKSLFYLACAGFIILLLSTVAFAPSKFIELETDSGHIYLQTKNISHFGVKWLGCLNYDEIQDKCVKDNLAHAIYMDSGKFYYVKESQIEKLKKKFKVTNQE